MNLQKNSFFFTKMNITSIILFCILYFSVWNIMFSSVYLNIQNYYQLKIALICINSLAILFPLWIYTYNIPEETVLSSFVQGQGYKLFF